jgi:hypothetical protein
MNKLQGVIDRTEGDFTVIKISGDQELYWPNNLINFNYQDGDIVNLYLSKDELETVSKTDEAKNILRQIFQPNV